MTELPVQDHRLHHKLEGSASRGRSWLRDARFGVRRCRSEEEVTGDAPQCSDTLGGGMGQKC